MGCTGSTLVIKDQTSPKSKSNQRHAPVGVEQASQQQVMEKNGSKEADSVQQIDGDKEKQQEHKNASLVQEGQNGDEGEDAEVVEPKGACEQENKSAEHKQPEICDEQKEEEKEANGSIVNPSGVNCIDPLNSDKAVNDLKSTVYNELVKKSIERIHEDISA